MNSEEIELLLDNSEKSIKLEILSTPLAGWTLSLGSVLLGIVSDHLAEGLFVAIPVGLISFFASFTHYSDWAKIKNRRAQLVWAHLAKGSFGIRLNGNSWELVKDISTLYQADPSGEMLPLSQAVRLVDTHYKQQQRLGIVIDRLANLYSVGAALKHKTELLRDLGESHQQGEMRLQSLRDDEIALATMREQIQASCHRLEMILIEARKAQQMRQLHREIGALTSEKTSSETSPAFLEPDSLFDIERQITREIDTFLQLERDTDRHLRAL